MSTGRADRLAARLAERELDALVVTNLVNVRYLTGFTGTSGFCVVGAEVRGFLTDFRYVEQAERETEGFELVRTGEDVLREVADRVASSGASRAGFEEHHLTVRQHGRLRERLADEIELVPAGTMVEDLRAVKEAGEVAAMRAAAAAGDGILEYLRDSGFGGRSEREVARDLEREMRARGVEPSFPTIVAAGPNGALPHHSAGDSRVEEGSLVIVDLGCVVDGYSSDCTRTFAAGDPGGDALEVYELVRETQERALGAVRAGADCKAVDGVARDAIGAAGHGDRFGHGLGHGVGMEVHEAPRLSQLADGALEEGNVVTVEPGVYLPGRLGARIEDLVLVGGDGGERLTAFPKSLVKLA